MYILVVFVYTSEIYRLSVPDILVHIIDNVFYHNYTYFSYLK